LIVERLVQLRAMECERFELSISPSSRSTVARSRLLRPVTSGPVGECAFAQGPLDGGAAAIRRSAWQSQYYEQLRAAGKPGQVAVIAAIPKLLEAVCSEATHRQTLGADLSAS